MGATKFEAYSQQQIEYAKFFKALGHPARIAVVENIMKSIDFESGFDELFDKIDLAQSTKSQHLKQLVEVGIIRTKLVSKNNRSCMRYRINKEAIEYVQYFLNLIHETIDWENGNYSKDNFHSFFYPLMNPRIGFCT